jgi:hypothetical protein
MGKQYPSIEPEHRDFIRRQHIFFTASAAPHGRVNVSPKDAAALRLLSPSRVIYLDMTGSGNETAAHLLADGRLTLMFCAFQGPPRILRLYGRGRSLPRGSAEYSELLASAFDGQERAGARQIVLLDVDLVQTSCGFGVPLFEYTADRDTLTRWAEGKGPLGLEDYRRQKNSVSLDGLPTGIAAIDAQALKSES